jgi:hypothetical protein
MVLSLIQRDKVCFDALRLLGVIEVTTRSQTGLRLSIVIHASDIDKYLREYQNSTLQEFMAECAARRPIPQGLSKMEVVLRDMWEHGIENIPVTVRHWIGGLMRSCVPFRIAAQIIMLSEANPRRVEAITLAVTGLMAVE